MVKQLEGQAKRNGSNHSVKKLVELSISIRLKKSSKWRLKPKEYTDVTSVALKESGSKASGFVGWLFWGVAIGDGSTTSICVLSSVLIL